MKNTENHIFKKFLDAVPFNTVELKKAIIAAGIIPQYVHLFYNGKKKYMKYEEAQLIVSTINSLMENNKIENRYQVSDLFLPLKS